MSLRPPSFPSTPSASTTPSTAITTPSPTRPRLLTPSGLRDVRIPDERITPDLAARLVMTTLESVLFLKSQIPMAVQAMGRLGESGKNARAVKKRVEFLQTLDTLSSHLYTTFLQLSAAYARREVPREKGETERAHVLITIGPPTGPAKEKVLLELEGMDVADWGRAAVPGDDNEGSARGDEESDEELEDEDERYMQAPADRADSDSSSSSGSPSPPPSPSPLRSPFSSPTSSNRASTHPTRLLALALINLIQSSTPPTHIHLLLRAPRRFSHISWAPRQTMSRALEGGCFGFSGISASKAKQKAAPEHVTVVASCPPRSPYPAPVSPTAREVQESEEDEMIWFEWTGKLTGFMEI